MFLYLCNSSCYYCYMVVILLFNGRLRSSRDVGRSVMSKTPFVAPANGLFIP